MKTPIKRVAAIHDISGYGRCSITVVLPTLSAMGTQCCVLPAAYLSNHTGFPQFTFVDMTDCMRPAIEHWKMLDLKFDAVYSGFLGSAEQIDIVKECITAFKGEKTLAMVDPVMGDNGKECITAFKGEKTLAMVDPVMGDNGEAYKTYTPAMCAKMGELVEAADLITPNMTEAALLLNKSYTDAPKTEATAREWLKPLSGDGKRSVVLTGYSRHEGMIGAAFSDSRGDIGFLELPFIGKGYHGTGDLFSSVLLGSLLRGADLGSAVETAAKFVGECARITFEEGTPGREGVRFEALLHTL